MGSFLKPPYPMGTGKVFIEFLSFGLWSIEPLVNSFWTHIGKFFYGRAIFPEPPRDQLGAMSFLQSFKNIASQLWIVINETFFLSTNEIFSLCCFRVIGLFATVSSYFTADAGLERLRISAIPPLISLAHEGGLSIFFPLGSNGCILSCRVSPFFDNAISSI